MPTSLAISRNGYSAPQQSSSGPTDRRITELDGLRGIAVSMVLLLHYLMRTTHVGMGLRAHAPRAWAMLDMSWCGVDLFFVISGFLIGGILLDHRDSSLLRKTFYARRACRILPVYALVVMLAFVPLFNTPAPALLGNVPWYAYALFIHNYWTSRGANSSFWLGPTWSIAIEEQFYLLAPFIVPLLSLRTLRRVLIACIVGAPLLRFLAFKAVLPVSFWDFTLCRLDAPAVGVLGALLLRDPSTRDGLVRFVRTLRRALPLVVASALSLSQLSLIREPVSGELILMTVGLSWLAMSSLVVLLVVTLEPSSGAARVVRARWLVYLGRRSYFVYLFHMPALFCVARWLRTSELERAPIALVLVLGFAELSWRFFETPLLRLGHRLSYRQPADLAQVPPRSLPARLAS